MDLNSGTLTQRPARGRHRPGREEPARSTSRSRTTSPARAAIGSPLAPVSIDQYTIDSRNNLRQSDDLHFYYAFQKDSRLEPNAQGQTVAGLSATGAAETARS